MVSPVKSISAVTWMYLFVMSSQLVAMYVAKLFQSAIEDTMYGLSDVPSPLSARDVALVLDDTDMSISTSIAIQAPPILFMMFMARSTEVCSYVMQS